MTKDVRYICDKCGCCFENEKAALEHEEAHLDIKITGVGYGCNDSAPKLIFADVYKDGKYFRSAAYTFSTWDKMYPGYTMSLHSVKAVLA